MTENGMSTFGPPQDQIDSGGVHDENGDGEEKAKLDLSEHAALFTAEKADIPYNQQHSADQREDCDIFGVGIIVFVGRFQKT